jgi:hypothetical protein
LHERFRSAFVRFDSLLDAQVLIEGWRIDYNLNRPHTRPGDLTPHEFAQAWMKPKPTSAPAKRLNHSSGTAHSGESVDPQDSVIDLGQPHPYRLISTSRTHALIDAETKVSRMAVITQ